MPTSRSRPSSRPARRRRSRSSPTSTGDPTDRREHQALVRLRRRARRRSTGSTTSRAPTASPIPTTGAALTPEQIAALYALPADQRPRRSLPTRCPRNVRPRLDGPPRRDQPARAVPPAGDRADPDAPGIAPGDGITTQVGGSAAAATTSSSSQARARALRGRADPARQRVVLFLLFGSIVHPAQGRDHDPAVDQRQLRRPGLDLPGGQPVGRAQLQRRSGTPSPATRSSCSASSSGCRWTTRSCSCRGSRRRTAGRATTRPRSPRACQDGRRHHRRGADHGLGVRGIRPGRHRSRSRASASAWPSRCSSTRRSSGSCSSRRRCGSWAGGTGGRPGSLGRFAERLGFSHVEDEGVERQGADGARARRVLRGAAAAGGTRGRGEPGRSARYRRPMRLLLATTLHRPDTVERLRALSPDLDVVDANADSASISTPTPTPPSRPLSGRGHRRPNVPRLRWLQVGSAGVDHLSADPPWRKGITVTNARGVYAVPMAEYVSWDGPPHLPADRRLGRRSRRASLARVRGRPAGGRGPRQDGGDGRLRLHRPGGGSPAGALGLRIVAIKPRPDVA